MKFLNTTLFYVLVYGIYCFLFIFIFNPFYGIDKNNLALYSIESATIGSLILYALILLSTKIRTIYLRYTSFSMACFLSPFLTGLLLFFIQFKYDGINPTTYFSSFVVIGILPASMVFLWFIFNRVLNQHVSVSDSPSIEPMIELTTDTGKIVLRINLSKTICFEANDNYVITYFLDENGDTQKSMNRISLKKIEEIISSKNCNFQRVHKSYMINPLFMDQLGGKSQNYSLSLKGMNKKIPVSRGFDVSVFDRK